MNRFFITIILIFTVSGCAAPRVDTFPEIVGASYVPPGLEICSDYGDTLSCDGFQIHYKSWGGEGYVYQNRTIAFHAEPGTPVISSSYGKIFSIRKDHECYGGRVAILSDIETSDPRKKIEERK